MGWSPRSARDSEPRRFWRLMLGVESPAGFQRHLTITS